MKLYTPFTKHVHEMAPWIIANAQFENCIVIRKCVYYNHRCIDEATMVH